MVYDERLLRLDISLPNLNSMKYPEKRLPGKKGSPESVFHICVCPQAVEQLNIKTKCYKDLLTDEPFTRKDIITLQVGLQIVHLKEISLLKYLHCLISIFKDKKIRYQR